MTATEATARLYEARMARVLAENDAMRTALLAIVERAHGPDTGRLHDVIELARNALAQVKP